MYHGIIDPSEFKMIEKSSDHAVLLEENKALRILSMILIPTITLMGIAGYYYLVLNQKTGAKKVE